MTVPLNLEEQNRFAPLSNDSSCGTKTCESGTNKNKFIRGLKFSSILRVNKKCVDFSYIV